MVEESQGSLQL